MKYGLNILKVHSRRFETNFLHISRALIAKSKRCFNMKSSTHYFDIEIKGKRYFFRLNKCFPTNQTE